MTVTEARERLMARGKRQLLCVRKRDDLARIWTTEYMPGPGWIALGTWRARILRAKGYGRTRAAALRDLVEKVEAK